MKLSYEEILKYQKDRPPYVFIDSVEELIPGKSAIALKTFDKKEWFFDCHFPDNPIVPGVLQLEMISQTGALILLVLPEYQGQEAWVSRANNVKWLSTIRPNDELEIHVTLNSMKHGIARMSGYIINKKTGKKVCEGDVVEALPDSMITKKDIK